MKEKELKVRQYFRAIIQPRTTLLLLATLLRTVALKKTNILCFFVDFRKSIDIIPRTNIYNGLEEMKVPFELRITAIGLLRKLFPKLGTLKTC